MKVLHLIPKLSYYGGTARKLQHLLCSTSDDVRHCCAVNTIDDADLVNNVEVFYIGSDGVRSESENVAAILRKENIDLVVAHFLHMGLVAMKACSSVGMRYVYQDHGVGLNPWFSTLYKYPFRFMVLKNASLAVFNSYATASSFYRPYPFFQSKFRVVHNGVSLPETGGVNDYRRLLNISKDAFVIGMVGGFLKMRKQETVINAFVKINKAMDAHLVFLGEGGEREKLVKALAARVSVDRIHFLPRSEFVGDFMSAIDVYVNSADKEGFGIATCEAMLMNTPVVVSNSCALKEYCFHNYNALLFEKDDYNSLADNIISLKRNSAMKKRLIENARKTVEERFSIDKYIRENNSICREVLNINK